MDTLLAARRRHWNLQGRRVLSVDVGDFLSGSPEAKATRGALPVALMKGRNYDAVLVGNRELTFGVNRLRELIVGPDGGLAVPLVSSNLATQRRGAPILGIPGTTIRSPEFARKNGAPREERPGERVRFLGFTPTNLKDSIEPEALGDVVIETSLGRVLRATSEQGGGVGRSDGEFTILLCQDDVVSDRRELTAAVAGTGVDLVIGHAYGKGAAAYKAGDTWFAGVRNDLPGSALVELHLDLDPRTGRVLSMFEGYLVARGRRAGLGYLRKEVGYVLGDEVDLADGPPPPSKAVLEVLKPFQDELAKLDEKISETTTDLWGAYEVESPLGNLVADLLAEAGRDAGHEVDASLISAGVVGYNRIPAGPIQRRHLAWMYGYSNSLEIVKVPGQALRDALAAWVEDDVRVLVSGIRYGYTTGKDGGLSPELLVGGQPVDPGRTYTLAMNSFLHRRSDALSEYEGAKVGDCQELLESALRRHDKVEATVEGRVLVDSP
jgi:5'-nucleotidase